MTGDDFLEHWVEEEAENQARDETRYDDDGERLLRVAADAGGHGGGEQAEASHERSSLGYLTGRCRRMRKNAMEKLGGRGGWREQSGGIENESHFGRDMNESGQERI